MSSLLIDQTKPRVIYDTGKLRIVRRATRPHERDTSASFVVETSDIDSMLVITWRQAMVVTPAKDSDFSAGDLEHVLARLLTEIATDKIRTDNRGNLADAYTVQHVHRATVISEAQAHIDLGALRDAVRAFIAAWEVSFEFAQIPGSTQEQKQALSDAVTALRGLVPVVEAPAPSPVDDDFPI